MLEKRKKSAILGVRMVPLAGLLGTSVFSYLALANRLKPYPKSLGVPNYLANLNDPPGRLSGRVRHSIFWRDRVNSQTHKEILSHLNSERGPEIVERFWAKVRGGPAESCWDWQASVNTSGYGRFKIVSWQVRHANRVAWTIANLRDPGDLIIRHTCDRPICCNPAHLIIGTTLDNSHDMMERGRFVQRDQRGENNGAARLTRDQIGEIVSAFRRGEDNTEIAARYPVGHALISRIRTARSWQAEAAEFGWGPAIAFAERKEAA
jgi:hypothetical protein